MEPLFSTPAVYAPSSPKEALPSSANQNDKPERSRTAQQPEPVSISQTGQEINRYTEAMANLPDIRQERITQIQTALEKGTYAVSSQDLADKLIHELSNQTPGKAS